MSRFINSFLRKGAYEKFSDISAFLPLSVFWQNSGARDTKGDTGENKNDL